MKINNKLQNNFLIINRKLNKSFLTASIFVFILAFIFYVYINISTVFSVINYKKSDLNLSKKTEELFKVENEINNYKNSLTKKDFEKYNLTEIDNNKFIVRKDVFTMYTLNYDANR